MLNKIPRDQPTLPPQVNYTANGLNINCGSWGSFAEEGMLGNNMGGKVRLRRRAEAVRAIEF